MSMPNTKNPKHDTRVKDPFKKIQIKSPVFQLVFQNRFVIKTSKIFKELLQFKINFDISRTKKSKNTKI